ncbi:response regulator [Sinorhizobium medicae]|uniref:Response regulator receiver protein n=1 Tax=Sinorhizobium medicae (strain WSM419) TaxID=366394 RepID=A6UN38_SINMW|nr:response regulator [Sinorhizobium medicae]ABR65068.1 response regulator receiver protein [Sinorhizobium medicae WSM419]
MKVLIVEDDNQKYNRVHAVLEQAGVAGSDITHVIAAAPAYELLRQTLFDLMLLDVNIPRRLGDRKPQRGGGLELLKDLGRESDLRRPTYIVGLTAYEDVVAEFGSAFEDQLWSLVHYKESSDQWIAQLLVKVNYIQAANRSRNFSDGETYGCDLAIITALDTVEFDAVQSLPLSWEPLRLQHDETRYLAGTLATSSGTKSVIAAAAPRMGIPASGILSSKIIHQFRPRFIAMVGICAGRKDKVSLGDLIVAEPTWDWGSGKISSEEGEPKFMPSPHQLDIDPDTTSLLKAMTKDAVLLAGIKKASRGTKPKTELSAHMGPLVSGAAVVAHKPTFDQLLDQHRGILGVDMEAYAVAAAAMGSAKPRPKFLIVKGVSDFADEHKDDDYQEFAASVSANFLLVAAKEFL